MQYDSHRYVTHLREVQLDISNGRALDDLRRLLYDTFCKHDALDLKAGGPLRHLLADLVGRDREQRLDRVGPLAQVQEHHLATLGTRALHPRTQEDGLSIQIWIEIGNLYPGALRTLLRLVQRKLAIELGCIVLLSSSHTSLGQ